MFEGARKSVLLGMSMLTALVCAPTAWGQASTPTPGQNVNMVSGTTWPFGDPFLERQDEPSLAVSTRNPLHLLAGANDYRTVDLNLLEAEPGEVNVCPTPGVTPCPSAEPWVGQYISVDGGARWQSTLLPGYPQDTSLQGTHSPLHGFTTASDPVVRAGTNGLFYYAGIAFNRGTSNGVVFVARYMDLNNKENGNVVSDSFPIRYMNTVVVAHGSNTQFLDKPWIAVDIPRSNRTCNLSVPQGNGSVAQTIPAGNVYVAYANIATVNGVTTSIIYFSRSTDCGNTWSTPIALSRGYALSQGATIQIDPQTGIVYVTWRTFHSGTKQPNDSIVVAASFDGGYFTPGFPIVTLPAFNRATPNAPAFFDQGTTQTSFRSAAYPVMAVQDSGARFIPGPVYFAWSQRGVGPYGEARIMMLAIPGNAMITPNGIILPTPFPVDNGPITDELGNALTDVSGHTLIRGHQWGPSMTFIEGKLMLIYYDQRLDHTLGEDQPNVASGFFAPDAEGRFYQESRQLEGELDPLNGSNFGAVFTPFVDDSNPPLNLRRHTIDVTLAQSDGGRGVPTFTYTRVSNYDFGLFFNEQNTTFHQLKVNPPGLPMFQKGTVPFMGDYIDIVGQMFVPTAKGGWAFNNPGVNHSSPVHYAAWTSNQDVIPPPRNAQGVQEWDIYTALGTGTSVYDGKTALSCTPGFEGDRNQNVYQSRITQGLLISSPQNSKPLSTTVQRAFVVLVQNFTNYSKNFQLTIANQPPGAFAISGGTAGGYASFRQALPNTSLPNPLPAPVTTQTVKIAAHSGVAATVFALSSNATASITVNANEVDQNGQLVSGGLSGFILLNADGTVPSLTNPDGAPQNTNITGVEIYDPGISGPGISGANANATNITAPGISGPGISGTTCGGPGISGPGISGPGISGSGCTSPGISGPGISGPGISGPGISGMAVVSTGLTGPNVPAPGISGSAVSDATYSVSNTGNTTAGYNVALVGCDTSPCKDTPLQLVLSQVYVTPGTDGQCHLIDVQQDIGLSNNAHPVFTPVSQLGNPGISGSVVSDASISLGPGDTALITLRGQTDTATMQSIVDQVAPAVIPQAIRTDSNATTPTVTLPAFITTTTLPDAVNGQGQSYASPGVQLQAIGGVPPYTWSVSSGRLPAGLTLSSNGLISGAPDTTAGTFPFTVQVTDSGSPTHNTALRQLSIRVAAPLVITTASPLPTATQGISYGPLTFLASGGIPPYSWTPVANIDGLTLSNSGVLSGTPTQTGTFTFTAQVTDSTSPSQTAANSSMTLNVVPFTPNPTNGGLLFDNWNIAGVLSGPTTATTFYLPSTTKITQIANYHYFNGGALPGTISLQNQNGQVFGPFATVGVTGQNNVANAAWVTSPNPNVIVPAGTYTVIDSNSATWSYNATFSTTAAGQVNCNCGFTRVWGFPVQVSTLTFLTQPSNTQAGAQIFPAVQVQALDSNNQPLPFITVTIGLGTNPGNGTLSGTLTQTTSQQGIDPSPFGIATFSNLSIDKAGAGYTLLASVNQITVTSNQFTLAAAASSGSRYLIVSDGRSSPSSIFRVAPDGSSTALVATLATGRAIAVSIDQTTNTLYSADPFNAEVWKVSLWGGAVSPLFAGSPLASPVAVAVDSAGNVYAGDNSTDAVYKITPAGALTLFANLPASPTNLQDIRMAFDAAGNLVVGSDFVGDVANVSEIDQISPTGVSTTVYNSATMNGGMAIKEIGGLAIDASGNIIVADYASSSIVKIANPGTSNMTATTLITNPGLGGSTAITGLTVVDSAAGIYDVTANFANKILSVNTSTNTITTLVSGAPLTYPTDIAMSGFIPTPQPATNVTAVVKSSIPPSVTLNWTASTSAVTSYNIYRKKQGENAFTRIASVSANSPNPTSYTDTAVAFGDSLHYYVTSVDSNNVESVPSNVVDTGLA